jgi:surface antigen
MRPSRRIPAWSLSAAAAALCVGLAAPAFADDDDDRGRGRGHDKVKSEVKDDGETYEYRYKDRQCKYRYRYDYRSGRAEVDQKGNCAHIAQAPGLRRPVRVVQGQPQPAPMPRTVPPAPQRTVARCDRERTGRILGGVVGGVIGSQVGREMGNQTVGTVGGILVGVVIGGAIGRSMDDADRACVGQALEWGHNNQTVQWERDGITYNVEPGAAFQQGGQTCRPYVTKARINGRDESVPGTACRSADGVWRTM